MVERDLTPELLTAAQKYPVATVLGPRQSGKTTLVRTCFPDKTYVSLEDPDVRMAAEEDPRGFFSQLPDGAILDEVQRLPILLSYIQGIVDEKRRAGLFILTGSHQPGLHQAISQSLAGRTALLTLWPLSLSELRSYRKDWAPYDLIVRGSFPRLHEEDIEPRRFYNDYVQTYVERDVRSLIQLRDLAQFQKFLTLLAGRTGQLVNFNSLSNDLGTSGTTLRNWLTALKASYLVLEIPPFHENIKKRVVKSPKLYFTDTGLAAFLLGIHDARQASRDPLRGSLYENMVIVDVLKGAFNKGIRPEIYFFRDSHGNEVDLIIREKGNLIPVEIKSASTFSRDFIKGLSTLQALAPDRLMPGTVLYNGEKTFQIHGNRVFNPLASDNIWRDLTGVEV